MDHRNKPAGRTPPASVLRAHRTLTVVVHRQDVVHVPLDGSTKLVKGNHLRKRTAAATAALSTRPPQQLHPGAVYGLTSAYASVACQLRAQQQATHLSRQVAADAVSSNGGVCLPDFAHCWLLMFVWMTYILMGLPVPAAPCSRRTAA